MTIKEFNQAFSNQRTPAVFQHGDFLSPLHTISSSKYHGTIVSVQSITGKPKQLQWTEESIAAFNHKNEALVNATMLTYPQANAALAITVDGSGVTMGAVIEQLVTNTWHPLAFFSISLWPTERKYSTLDYELLAIYLAMQTSAISSKAEILQPSQATSHSHLAFAKASELWSSQQQCHLTVISKYTTCIKHVSGKSNTVADALSRININCCAQPRPRGETSLLWLQLNKMTNR